MQLAAALSAPHFPAVPPGSPASEMCGRKATSPCALQLFQQLSGGRRHCDGCCGLGGAQHHQDHPHPSSCPRPQVGKPQSFNPSEAAQEAAQPKTLQIFALTRNQIAGSVRCESCQPTLFPHSATTWPSQILFFGNHFHRSTEALRQSRAAGEPECCHSLEQNKPASPHRTGLMKARPQSP